MGLRDVKKRLSATSLELDKARRQERFAGVGITPIGDAPARQPIRVVGEVHRMRSVARDGNQALEVTISDGSGDAVAMFTGIRKLGGVAVGGALLLEGVARSERGRLMLMNPAYTLLP